MTPAAAAGNMQTLTLPSAAHSQSAMEDLPDELLAEILRRLPPRGLAACRSVCKHWRGEVVDTRGLLLAVAHLVPCPLCGIFINYLTERSFGFFSRTAPGTTTSQSSSIDVTLSFLPSQLSRDRAVLDHRSGLLLFENGNTMCVCNPVTRRWATLPPPPRVPPQHSHQRCYRRRMYLLFDPTMSLHYDVLFFPDVIDEKILQPAADEQQCSSRADYVDNSLAGSMEWPPYMYPVQVFSSRNNRWEEKQFIRQGAAAVTVSDVNLDALSPISSRSTVRNHAVFWRASFYVHCDIGFIMRLSLEEQTYLAIKTPKLDTTGYEARDDTYGYLGKSKHGVYYTAINGYRLHVWVLMYSASESTQTPEWELKHRVDIEPILEPHYYRRFRRENIQKCWILDSHAEESEDTRDYEWDSSDDTVVDAKEEMNPDHRDYFFGLEFLGYHPYKEIVFLDIRFEGFAYYLDNSKLQYVGSPYPAQLKKRRVRLLPLVESFIYTPCMDDLLPFENDHDE